MSSKSQIIHTQISLSSEVDLRSKFISLPTSKLLLITEIVNRSARNSLLVEGLLAISSSRVTLSCPTRLQAPNACRMEANSKLSTRTSVEFDSRSDGTTARWIFDSEIRKDVIVELLMLHFETASFTSARLNAGLAYRYGAEAPRLISQVRKERQRLSSAFSTDSLLEEDVGGGALEHGRADAFLTSQAIAHNAILLCSVWRKAGAGQGLTVSMIRLPLPSLLMVKAPAGLESLDSAVVSVMHHPKTLALKHRSSIEFEVKLVLRSYYHAPIQYTVEALDTIKESDLIANGRQLVTADSLRWIGKTSYLQATLSAYGTCTLVFFASISSVGAYDLRRLKIILSSDAEGTLIKKIPSTCLLHVTP